MSAPASLSAYAAVIPDKERGHRKRVWIAAAASIFSVAALAIYGADYYLLSAAERPFSPKHHLLKPSGAIGIKLGMLGVFLFLLIFLYAARKRIPWLVKRGKSKHWLDFHVVAGLTAPIVIAFHSSFKFQGIAGMAFWIMIAVAISGIVGRYIYAQIPRSLDSAELSLKELQLEQDELAAELTGQKVVAASYLQRALCMPSSEEVRAMPLYRALLLMILLDASRPFRIARLRMQVSGWSDLLLSLGGLLSTSNQDLERVIRSARKTSALSKRIAFLARTQQVFHLWHVIHRPFSYSFAVLALVHIGVVLLLGYF